MKKQIDLSHKQSVSVIIPVLNEEENIGPLLQELNTHHKPHEIIVADGGSSDQTCEIASGYAKVIHSVRGRAHQMNSGADAATGEIFLFLHADTQLPHEAMEKIRAALADTGKNSGRFRMSFGHPHFLFRFYHYYTRFHFFSYGDQAFFVTRQMFEKTGGFRTEACFEDIDFYRRLMKFEKPVILKDAVITSPRRFIKKGLIRQQLINILLVSMYYLGLGKQPIEFFKKKWYKEIR
jgi:rSAM/selenodomain-associated transferase 2